jgi:glutathione S-transferase
MKIYGDVLSPFVRMCLVTAHEVGLGEKLQHEKESVNPTKVNPKLAALSPIGKVPVLQTDHGHPLYDSRVIIEYLCHVSGNMTIIPDDGVKRFRVLTLQALCQGLGDAAVGTRYETVARPQGLQWTDWITRVRSRMNMVFDDLEGHWVAEKAEVNAGSIAAAVVLSYIDFRLPDITWRDGRPKLTTFHERFSARDSMKRTALAP